MTTALLIRHAATDSGDVLLGRLPGVHLSAAGHAAAVKLATRLHDFSIGAIYTSPRERAVETAAAIAAIYGLLPIVDHAFDELNYGDWTGQRIAALNISRDLDWSTFNKTRSTARIPNGEWMIEAQLRAIMRMNALVKAHNYSTIAIVSHADIIKAMIAHYFDTSLNLLPRMVISPAFFNIVEFHISNSRVIATKLSLPID